MYRTICLTTFIICFVFQSHYKFSNPATGPDKITQVASAYQLLEGRGISLPFTNLEDLSALKSEPLGLWPPGYAVFYGAVHKLFPNFILADLFLNILAIGIFLLAWLLILFKLEKEYHLRIIPFLFIFWAFSSVPFRAIDTTDMFSLAFFSMAIYFAIQTIFSEKKYTNIILATLFAFLCSFFRYAYYPITMAIPLFYLIYAILSAKVTKFQAILSILITAILFTIQISYQVQQSGYVNHVEKRTEEVEKRIHWEHLIHYDAVPFNSFFFDYTIYRFLKIDDRAPNPSRLLYAIFFFVSLIILTLLAYGMYRVIQLLHKKTHHFKSLLLEPLSVFWVLAFLAVGANLGLLTLLSLRYPSGHPDHVWTFIMLPRYFALAYVLIQVSFFIVVFYKIIYPKLYYLGVYGLLLASFLFYSAHWLYIKSKFSLLDPIANLDKSTMEGISETLEYQKWVAKQEDPVVILIRVDKNRYQNDFVQYGKHNSVATLVGARLLDFNDIKERDLKTTRPIKFIVPVNKRAPQPDLMNFCKKMNGKKIPDLEGGEILVYEIPLPATKP